MKNISDIGIIGLGVMGKSLALNMARKQIGISVFNRHLPEKEERIASTLMDENKDLSSLRGFDALGNFMESLKSPKSILIMVTAGDAVDHVIDDIEPFLEEGDIIIDGGNSHYRDTERRQKGLFPQGIHFLGLGISGGEEGALNGPSLMPGGNSEAYKKVEAILRKVAAVDKNGSPCISYLGDGGAGHFVKMIHNGIEYAEMQLLAETYDLLKNVFNLSNDEIADFFHTTVTEYKGGFLSEITEQIFRYKEEEHYLVDKILDQSGHKGTGRWSVDASLEYGVASPTITLALYARFVSSDKARREALAEHYFEKIPPLIFSREHGRKIQQALYVSRLINHIIGFDLISKAAGENLYDLSLSEVARVWTNGCIIRSGLMEELVDILHESRDLFENDKIKVGIKDGRGSLADVLHIGFQNHCALPVMSSALNYLNSMTRASSTANLIQAQRDFFGAHTYQRIDMPDTEFFHTDWKK